MLACVKGITMSKSLPTNKKDKADRLIMLAKQGSITWAKAQLLFQQYCRLYDKCIEVGELTAKHLRK